MTSAAEGHKVAPQRRWRSLALGAAVLFARPLVAQEAAPEMLRPQPVDTTIAGGVPAPTSSYSEEAPLEPPAVPSWDLFVRAGGGWEYNPSSAPLGSRNSWLQLVNGGFVFQRVRPRGAFLLGGSGGAVRYQSATGLNRYIGRANLGLSRQLSSRSSFNLSSSTEVADGRNSRLLADSGLLYNARVRTLSNWTSAGLDQRIGSRSSFAVGARTEIITFDDPTLVDGNQIVARASVSRQTSASTNLGANYSHRWSSRSGARWQSDFVFGSFSARPGPRSLLNISAGGTRSTGSGVWRPYGVAELGLTSRHSTFSLRASTTVSQAYGVGAERAVSMVRAAVTRQLGRRASMSLTASYSHSSELTDDGVDETAAYNTGRATVGLEVPLTRHFGLEGRGYYRLRRAAVADILDVHTGGVTVFMYLRKIPR